MMVFGFYIRELGRKIYLDMWDIVPFIKYLNKEIGWTKFYKTARNILLYLGVPKNMVRFVALRILYFLETRQYDLWEIEEKDMPEEVKYVDKIVKEGLISIKYKETKYAKVRCKWHARVEYCEKGGHHLVVEGVVVFEYTIPIECWRDNLDNIESYIDNKLWNAFTLFLDTYYVLIYTNYDSGITEHDIVAEFNTATGTPLEYEIISADIYVGRNCAYEPEWRDDLSNDWETFVESYIEEIKDWLESLCGIRWV